MEIVKIEPLGFCNGVNLAITKVKEIRENNKNTPIYLWSALVHNRIVNDELNKLDIRLLSEDDKNNLDKLDKGIIVTSAHGTTKETINKIINNGFKHLDATCPIISKMHEDILTAIKSQDVLFYGKKNHPEMISTLALSNKIVPIYSDTNDIDIKDNSILFTQSTFIKQDVYKKYEQLKKCNDSLKLEESLCNATSLRQERLNDVLPSLDHVLIIGDSNSNNANSLLEIVQRNNVSYQFINNKDELDINLVRNKKRVGIASATSTPLNIIEDIISSLK